MWFFWLPTAVAIPLKYFISTNEVESEPFVPSIPLLYHRSEAIQSNPVMPLIPWGLRFDEDLMIALDDPIWGMIEVAKVSSPTGDAWFSLDSKQDGRQYVGVNDTGISQQMVVNFPASWTENQLQVEELEGIPREGWTSYNISYQRIDGEQIAFQMSAPDADKAPSKRNGNAMNHSQGAALALLDLYSIQLPRTKMSWTKNSHPVQRIMGVPITARMRQATGGIQTGEWLQQAGALVNEKHQVSWMVEETEGMLSYTSVGQYPMTSLQYEVNGSELRLRNIQVLQSHPTREDVVLDMTFSPPLPDLRYGAPVDEFMGRVYAQLNGQDNYYQGDIAIQGNSDFVQLELNSKGPQWAIDRPIYTTLRYTDQGVEIHSWVLSAGDIRTHHFRMERPEAKDELGVLSSVSMLWEKNPHRLSHLSFYGDSPEVKLGGGSWANGSAASDTAHYQNRSTTLLNGTVYEVTSPVVALIKDVNEAKETVKASMVLEIPFHLQNTHRAVPFLNGVTLSSGGPHKNLGVTTSELQFEIVDIEHVDDVLFIEVQLAQGFGSVPDRRQDLEGYSALASVNIGIVVLPIEQRMNQETITATRFLPRKIQLGQMDLEPCTDPVGRMGLLQKWHLEILDSGKHRGRYIRGIQLSSDVSVERDRLVMAAKFPRDTHYRITKDVVSGTNLIAAENCDH